MNEPRLKSLKQSMDYVQAEVHPGAWKLEPNDIWNVPDDTNELRHDIETRPGFHQTILKIVGLAIDLDGKIYGMRSLISPKESGYQMEGRVSIGGKKHRAFTSSKLFERPDGSLCDVGVLIVVRKDK